MSHRIITTISIIIIAALLVMGAYTYNIRTQNMQRRDHVESIIDSRNKVINLAIQPQRIISGAPNITEILCALDLSDKLVGRTNYCDYPAYVKDLESIGQISSPNIEKIISLNPDIIIVENHFPQNTIDLLEAQGITVAQFNEEEAIDQICITIDQIGVITGRNEKALKLHNDILAKLDSVSKDIDSMNRPRVYYAISAGASGDFTAGGDTFINKIIEISGGINVAKDVKGWSYSLEKLLLDDPDVIICSRYEGTKNVIQNANGYKDLRAVKNKKVYEIDTNLLERKGPRLGDGADILAQLIYQ